MELRPDIEESLTARDGGTPHQLDGFTWLGVGLAGGLRCKPVPRSLWSLDTHDAGHTAAFLTCQCGTGHCLAGAEAAQPCPCGRGFFFDGTVVWALNSPTRLTA